MRLNGWQRLWLVGTVCLALWLVGWAPLEHAEANKRDFARAEIEKDFRNPECRPYQVGAFSTLNEPRVGGSCWEIYTRRKYSAEVPYTLEAYDRDNNALWWKNYREMAAIGIGATIVFSGLVYLCGLIVGWIYRGFRRA
jgi:hypothetical protein